MKNDLFEDVVNGITAKGPGWEMKTDTPIEGIVVAIGVAIGLGAFAYGIIRTAYKKVAK